MTALRDLITPNWEGIALVSDRKGFGQTNFEIVNKEKVKEKTEPRRSGSKDEMGILEHFYW